MLDAGFLVATLLVVITLLFYILYWGRFLALLIGLVSRVVLWNRGGSSAWVQIGSFHLSLLAGRILLKDFHYHSSNQTFKVVKVQLRWQYWVRSLTHSEDIQSHGGGEGPKSGHVSRSPRCRFHATFEGFEWFIYNRTAAFDNIVSRMEANTPVPELRAQGSSTDRPASQLRHIFTKPPAGVDNNVQTPHVRNSFSTPKFLRNFVLWLRGQLPDLDVKNLLPFSFEGLNGGIVCGNMATPNILVAEFSRADGIFGTVPSKSPLDLYKQLLNIKFNNATISLKENDQYLAPMTDIGSHIHGHLHKAHSLSFHYFHYLTYSVFSKLYRSARLRDGLRAAAQVFKKQPVSAPPKAFRSRSKRAQSVDIETPVGPDSAKREYAIDRRLLEAPVLELSYYVDVAGVVPAELRAFDHEEQDIGNGDTSPEWGLDLVVHGGFLRYGPWADRQRAELQRVFFPPTYQEADRTHRRRPGEDRIWTAMRIFVELRGGTTLQVPFREASKNWQWDGYVNAPRPRTREAASLSIKVGDDSTIRYLMPMVADAQGYHPHLNVHMNSMTVSSSLNDTRLLSTKSCEISGEMPSPLKWDAGRQWAFAVSFSQPIFYLLRDHINMFTDLGRDWSSGPPSNFSTWVPMRYSVNLDFDNYEINTYVNDHNIIDKPLQEDNALLTLRGRSLHSENTILSDKFRPAWTSFPFSISIPKVTLSLTLPKWSTHHLQTEEPITKLMTVGRLRLNGSYLYHSDVREENVDQLRLRFIFDDLKFKCLGWSIRHFMIFQQNYFGIFTHFSTLREYLQKRSQGQIGDPIDLQYRPGMSNQMQVEVQLSVNHSLITLPVGLPGYEEYCPLPGQTPEDVHLGGCIVLSAPEIEVQLRSHSLGLEMNFNTSTIYGTVESDYSERSIFSRPPLFPSSEVMLIEGVDILANRLFGPQPPATAYVCFWEINVGSVKGVFSASHVRTLRSALDAFAMNYKDPMNAPAAEFVLPVAPDVTFLKVTFASVNLTWSAAPVSVHCYLPQGFQIVSNDLAGNNYRKVTSISVPGVVTRFLHSLGKNNWVEAGEVAFDVALDHYSSPPGWQGSALSQAKFLAEQDEPTGRLRKLKIGLGMRGHWIPSRSVYAAILRLPRPHLPLASTTTHHASPHEDTRQGTDLTRPTPFFQRHVYFDSDDEGSYTAMGRDARLANSRPSSMLPLVQADDGSMSGGDESDDMDLTDGSSYGSDASEWNEGIPAGFEYPFAFRYSKVSRHYSLPIGRPSTWVANPVVTLRDRRPPSAPAARPEATRERDEDCPYERWKADITEDSGTSTTRVLSHSIEIWVTPLLPSVVTHLLEDNSRPAISLEEHIDSLTTSHIRDLLNEQDTGNDSIFDVQISSIRAQAVQLVQKPRGHHDGFLHAPEATHDSLEDKVAVLDFQIFDLSLKAQVHKEEKHSRQSFALSTDRTSLSLDLHDVHSPVSRWGNHTVVKASLSEVTSALVHKHADLAWRALTVALEMDAADYISEVVSAHTDPIIHAVNTYRRLQSRLLSATRDCVHQTLQRSKSLSVVDPLSTIQPSYLIQTGRPHEIRVHAASKILLYIRSCLRSLTAGEREAVCHLTRVGDAVVTREEVLALLEGQLAGLAVDTDAAGLANLKLIIRMFGAPDLPKVIHPREPIIQAAGIKLQAMKVAILHPKHGPPSEVSLDTLNITVAVKKSGLLLGSSKSPKNSLSVRDKRRSVVQHVAVSVALDGLEVLILPHILNFAQSLVRLRNRSNNATPISSSISPPHLTQGPLKTTLLVDATLSLQSLRFQVAAEKLIVAFIVSRLGLVSSVYGRPNLTSQGRLDMSANASLFFDSVALQARSSTDKGSPTPQDMLAEISLKKTGLNFALRHEVALNPTIRAALAVGCLQLSVPRSAIRLSRFIEEWKADYLPSFEQTVQALVSELRQEPKVPSSPTSIRDLVPATHLQLSIGSCGVFLHVLPGTWLSWELLDTVAHLKLGVGLAYPRQSSAPFGLRFSSQRINISSLSKGERLEDTSGKGGLKVDLPSMTVTGTYENRGVHVLVSAGFFSFIVKPSYWDTLLSVQQKFGNDINDLLYVLADARTKRPSSQGPAKSQPFPSQPLFRSGAFKTKGFRIGLEGHSSTLFLECQDISGSLTDGESKGKGKFWQLNAIGLALSLAPRFYAVMKSEPGRFDGNRRSAFVQIDCKAEVDHRTAQKFLKIKVYKIHAIMQPSSIGEIGDFIDHLQAEVLDRKDERVRELAVFKEKTQSIFKSFEVNDRESAHRGAVAWFKDCAIVFSVSNVGVAFPLALEGSIELPVGKSHQQPTVSAFLFSVETVEFEDKNKGDSQFVMKGFSFRFVDRFRHSISGDFAGDRHQTRNCLVYPDMTAQVRTERSENSRRIRVGASISGFILDLEPSIADHVASLVDVYRRGKERVDRITVNVPRNTAIQDPRASPRRQGSESNEAVRTVSSFLLSMVFLSGQVRMHSSSPRTGSLYDNKGHMLPASVIESFDLPMLSVWGEYRAMTASRGATMDQDADPSSLVLKSTIHSSENTLRPSLLPFITELVNHIERRMHKASSSSSSFSNRGSTSIAHPELDASNDNPPVSDMHITFALRIDQSKLQLTCQPDVNVIAGVYWDSGGFLLNVSRSGRRMSFIGNVGGLTIGLKHGFLSEDCVRLDAHNLAFSTAFTGVDESSRIEVNSISIVVDTEVSGGLRFSRFQDVLCFKAVWLDRIPVLSTTPSSELVDHPQKTKGPPTPGAVSTKSGLTTAVLVRFRRIGLNVDLGQSISSVRLDMLDVIVQSNIEKMRAELSVSIGDLNMSATGNISGHARIPDFSFNTMRRKALMINSFDRLGEPRMLDMSLKSGRLEMTLESDYQKILHLRSEPLSIAVWDDWTEMSPQVAVLDRLLRLSFVVSGAELIAVGSVSTIPKLFSYGSRFQANLQAQREGAARESKAFRIAHSPKPVHPLSAFANAMLQTARTRLREKEDSLSYVVQQRMQFSLGSLKLVVFPRTMEDNEMASFGASELRADLDLVIESNDLPAKRKLLLAFTGMSASRVGPLNHGMVPDDVRTDVRKWLDVLRKGMPISTIFELPAMDMVMESEEISGMLEYNFESKFAQGGKPTARREDIFITLNVALYSWLTLLRKNLARELSQARGPLDHRQGAGLPTGTPSGASTPRRRRTITESSTLDTTSPPTVLQIDRHVSSRPRVLTRSDAATERHHKTTVSMSAMPSRSDTLGPPIELAMPPRGSAMPPVDVPITTFPSNAQSPPSPIALAPSLGPPPSLVYQPRRRHIERLQMRQLGEATPDVMHPFFTKKAGFSLEDALPQYVHEYATMPIEEITRALLKLYSQQLSHSAPQ